MFPIYRVYNKRVYKGKQRNGKKVAGKVRGKERAGKSVSFVYNSIIEIKK